MINTLSRLSPARVGGGVARIGRVARRFGVIALAVPIMLGGMLVVPVPVPVPVAGAAPDPGSGDCPNGYAAARANTTYVGGGIRGGSPSTRGKDTGTFAVPKENELIGTGCFHREPNRGSMEFRWSSVGEIYSGTFVYQVFDCTTSKTSNELTRRIGFPSGTKSTSGSERADVALDPGHTYRMRITGEGSYQRPAEALAGSIGYWSMRPLAGEPWLDETPCL